MDETPPRTPHETGQISLGTDERARPETPCDPGESAFGATAACSLRGDGIVIGTVGDASPRAGDDP